MFQHQQILVDYYYTVQNNLRFSVHMYPKLLYL